MLICNAVKIVLHGAGMEGEFNFSIRQYKLFMSVLESEENAYKIGLR